MKHNQLTVLQEVTHNQRRMYEVRCDCGRVEVKRKDHVLSGRAKSCKSCASKATASRHPPPVVQKGCGDLSGTHYNAIKNGAKRRGIQFSVTKEYLWNLYQEQNGMCALSGVEITLSRKLKRNNVDWDVVTASVDRINNTKGYVEGNLWWVHKDVNRLKNNYSVSELLAWCSLVVNKHGNTEPSVAKEVVLATKVQRLGGEDSYQ